MRNIMKSNFVPPLRLILTNRCNGLCPFCHKEGYQGNSDMVWQDICACANTAEELALPNITLTGGEPTLRADLPDIISELQKRYSGHISLTTNGYNLEQTAESLQIPLYAVNLSVSSFSQNLWGKYQNVLPKKAIKSLLTVPAINKKFNIVITKDNYQEIKDIISFCISNSISLDIMFELKEYNTEDLLIQKFILTFFSKLGEPIIHYGPTPSLTIEINDTCKISIKHPTLSSLVKWDICCQCKVVSECFERVCAVRVYPNGIVTPCLNHSIIVDKGDQKELKDRIYDAYDVLGKCEAFHIGEEKLILNNTFCPTHV